MVDMDEVIAELEELGESVCIGERTEFRGPRICAPVVTRGMCMACYTYCRKHGLEDLMEDKGRRGPKPARAHCKTCTCHSEA